MVEWSITTVLKTVVLRGTGGSNPSPSAKKGSFGCLSCVMREVDEKTWVRYRLRFRRISRFHDFTISRFHDFTISLDCLFLCRRRRRICSICLIIAKRYVDWDENERTKTNCNEHEKWNAHEPLARRSQWHEWEPRTALRRFYCFARNHIKSCLNLGAKPRNRLT